MNQLRSLIVIATAVILAGAAQAQQQCLVGVPRNAPDSRYNVQADDTVRDLQTGLIWKRCSEGQSGSTCSGVASVYTWAQALQVASTSSFAGQNDWRLPSIKELMTLSEYTCAQPSINANVFPNTPFMGDLFYFWSSTTFISFFGSDNAWYVTFFSTGASNNLKTLRGGARLVRGGQ